MYFPNPNTCWAIGQLYTISGILSAVHFTISIVLLVIERKKTAWIYLCIQFGIIILPAFGDFLAAIGQPMILIPYFVIKSLRYPELAEIPEISTRIGLFIYIFCFLISLHTLLISFNYRISVMNKNRALEKWQKGLLRLANGIGLVFSFLILSGILGIPLASRNVLLNGKQMLNFRGSGLYTFFVDFFGMFIKLDLDHLPADVLSVASADSSVIFFVTSDSTSKFIFLIIFTVVLLFSMELGRLSFILFYLLHQLKEKMYSKRGRQLQAGYIRVLFLQTASVILCIGIPGIMISLSLIGVELMSPEVPASFSLFMMWHTILNSQILIFTSRTVQKATKSLTKRKSSSASKTIRMQKLAATVIDIQRLSTRRHSNRWKEIAERTVVVQTTGIFPTFTSCFRFLSISQVCKYFYWIDQQYKMGGKGDLERKIRLYRIVFRSSALVCLLAVFAIFSQLPFLYHSMHETGKNLRSQAKECSNSAEKLWEDLHGLKPRRSNGDDLPSNLCFKNKKANESCAPRFRDIVA
ncbi:unnamed protein product, partial [Mesorhabditis belari]|uniref:G protein-coupled receptor n=1 Tax=Mesorhabditis belari TaxID=2138241 RepID=A0AAF3F5M8_9BILA